jgi:hypothetical protein
MPFKTKVRKYHDRIEPRFDTMKYWRLIRHWAKIKYKLSIPDMDLLFYLYAEGLFTRECFDGFAHLLKMNPDYLDVFIERGFVIKWREHAYHQKALYELSYKAKRMVYSIYAKLNGEDTIPTNAMRNPMYLAGATKASKRYRWLIKKFNEEVKERRLEKWRKEKINELNQKKKDPS